MSLFDEDYENSFLKISVKKEIGSDSPEIPDNLPSLDENKPCSQISL